MPQENGNFKDFKQGTNMVRQVYSKAGFRWNIEEMGPERSLRYFL